MKTLKQELQEIVDGDKLKTEEFICRNLSWENGELIQQYKEMASKYAKSYFTGKYAWWVDYGSYGISYDFVISEKYRFIKDLIAIL